MSNREIAEKVFVSENTVKTHSSRVSITWREAPDASGAIRQGIRANTLNVALEDGS